MLPKMEAGLFVIPPCLKCPCQILVRGLAFFIWGWNMTKFVTHQKMHDLFTNYTCLVNIESTKFLRPL